MSTTDGLVNAISYPELDAIADPLSKTVRATFEAMGAVGQQAKNALHGVWLGHPLHPVLTDVPLGAWTTALALDMAAKDDPGMRRAATFGLGVGLVGAIGAALSGLTDWSETDGESRRTGLIHGVLNLAATTLLGASYLKRRADTDSGGSLMAWAGYALAVGSAYLGGDLVYGQRIGVTHAAIEEPEAFTEVAHSAEVAQGSTMAASSTVRQRSISPASMSSSTATPSRSNATRAPGGDLEPR